MGKNFAGTSGGEDEFVTIHPGAYAGGADGVESPEILNILGVFSCLV